MRRIANVILLCSAFATMSTPSLSSTASIPNQKPALVRSIVTSTIDALAGAGAMIGFYKAQGNYLCPFGMSQLAGVGLNAINGALAVAALKTTNPRAKSVLTKATGVVSALAGVFNVYRAGELTHMIKKTSGHGNGKQRNKESWAAATRFAFKENWGRVLLGLSTASAAASGLHFANSYSLLMPSNRGGNTSEELKSRPAPVSASLERKVETNL